MFKNYFKTAWRNLKDKQFCFLNLIGLSSGLASVLLIYLWVGDELSIDKFNENDSRLYQVLKKNTDGTEAIRVGETTQGLLAESLIKEMPEVEFAACVKKEREPGILLSDKTALKLFNTTNVVGKTVSWNYKDDDIDFSNVYKITGVFKVPPSN